MAVLCISDNNLFLTLPDEVGSVVGTPGDLLAQSDSGFSLAFCLCT